jgi:hypothetical protein
MGAIQLGGEPYVGIRRTRELPYYNAFTFPAANLADAGTEEIEIDQALSLVGRRGRRLLGAQIGGLGNLWATERITHAADIVLSLGIQLNTRTGSFSLADPEQLWVHGWYEAINVTEGSSQVYQNPYHIPPEGEVYVAPRLFWRFTNDLDRTSTAAELNARIASVSQPLNLNFFYELLERFADLALL